MANEPGQDARPLVRSSVERGIALVVLDRPESLDAVNDSLREQLLAALENLADDTAVRAVVLTGAGRAICAGGDIKAMSKRLTSRRSVEIQRNRIAQELLGHLAADSLVVHV